METYLFKTIVCSAILIAFYYLFLAKEKTFKFNRWYLLFALVFSHIAPLITIKLKQPKQEKETIIFSNETMQPFTINSVEVAEKFNYFDVLFGVYLLIACALLVRFFYSIIKIKTLKGRRIIYQNRNVVLLDKEMSPFSFMNTIYLSKNYFENEIIDERIFFHEEIHLKQKHSLDILFIEFFKIFWWFDPFISFYKTAMITNHEFIADQSVINKNINIKNYQELILKEVLKQQNFSLIHKFNFNNTKKRFIMMTNKNSKFAKVKNYLSLPIMAMLLFLFAQKSYANEALSITENSTSDLKIAAGSNLNNNDLAEKEKSQLEEVSLKTDTIKPKQKINQQRSEEVEPAKDEKASVENILNQSYVAPPPPPTSAMLEADELPEFPGGLKAFRNLLGTNFNQAIFDKVNGALKTEVYFVVEKDGTISEVSAGGENEKFNIEAVRATKVSSEGQLWKPAIKDGKPVRYRFKIPMAMQFE